MMDFAVVLYFDSSTEGKIQTLIKKIADGIGNTYMVDHAIPPHVTVAYFGKEISDGLPELLEQVVPIIGVQNVDFASVGVFNPSVIFLAPVFTEYLLRCCTLVNEKLKPVVTVNSTQHLPDHWVPHATLAVKMSPDELKTAFDIVQREFKAFSGKATRMALAYCNPYREIRIWEL